MLAEELGVAPSERMMEQFRDMSSHISNRPGTVEDIKHGLQEDKKDWARFTVRRPASGMCTAWYAGIWSAAAGPFIFWSAP